MKFRYVIFEITSIILVLFFSFSGCKNKTNPKKNSFEKVALNDALLSANNQLTKAAQTKNFGLVENIYSDSCLLLAEYQPMIDGKQSVRIYYEEIFRRQNITRYTKKTSEVFDFETLVLEIGTFEKEFVDEEPQTGKYFNVWKKNDVGDLILKAEAFGYFKTLDDPAVLRVLTLTDESAPLLGRSGKVIPMEIQAYHALGENRVRDRDTEGVVGAYTPDAVYYPYADSAKTGTAGLLKHFTEYHRNPVKIDTIETWTYDYDEVKDGFIRYSKFYVEWTVPGFSGKTEGTGIAYWKRTKDNALKIHRQIGIHIHDPE